MRSLLLVVFAAVALSACGDIVPLEPDAAPGTCAPACGEHATCNASSSTCACDTGYEGDGQTCTDVNECMTNNGGCDPNAACFNNEGGRNCGCNTGFVGDGITCRRVWESRGSAQIKLTNVVAGQTNDASITAVGNRIFFAPETGGDGDISNHFMRSFDTQAMTFSPSSHAVPPAGVSDFCACGYGQIFVGDTAGNAIYMFGNDGYRYAVASNTWTAISTYNAQARGEAAGAFESNNNTVFMIGGRGSLNNALRYNVAGGGTFMTEPGTLPFGIDSAVAWAPTGNNVTYLAGGFASDNSRTHFLSHPTGTSTWNTLPNVPIANNTLISMGDWQGKIWVASRQQMAFFDIAAGTWGGAISLPGGFAGAVTVGTRTFGLFQGGDTLEVMELMAIQ